MSFHFMALCTHVQMRSRTSGWGGRMAMFVFSWRRVGLAAWGLVLDIHPECFGNGFASASQDTECFPSLSLG